MTKISKHIEKTWLTQIYDKSHFGSNIYFVYFLVFEFKRQKEKAIR
jgi:hypothetical protein